MQKHEVRTPSDALAYIVDCQLATVAEMAMKKTRGKFDYQRHIAIAQSGLDWMRGMDVPLDGTRAGKIENGDVAAWAKKYEV